MNGKKDLGNYLYSEIAYANMPMANMKTLQYKFSNEGLLKFFLRKDVEYIYSPRLIQTRDNKN